VPLKVLNLTSTRYGIGGVERLILSAADKYDVSRVSVAYCNLFCDRGGEGEFPRALRRKRLSCFDVPGHRWSDLPSILRRLVRLLRGERFDVLHTHMLQATLIGHVAARIARTPVAVVTRHYTDDVLSQRPLLDRLDRRATRGAARVIAVSAAVRDQLVQRGVSEERVRVVHNGIDLRGFDAAVPEEPLPWPDSWNERFLIGCVGGLFPQKGHADLLRAMSVVTRSRPDARLAIIGEGPERAALEKRIAELGMGCCVRLCGFRRDAAALLRCVDLYVHPSLHESFGISILEAMAAARPVIATRTGGIPEVVADGETGVLVPPGDAPALSAAILDLAASADRSRRLGEAGRRRVEQRFEIRKTVQACEALYEEHVRG